MPVSLGRAWGRAWAFERGTLWALELDYPEPVAPTQVPVDTTFGEVLAGDDMALAAAMGAPDPDVVRERLAGGRRCFVANVESTLAAYGWVSQGTERIGELERTMVMLPGEAYIWDCATLPAFRRRGLYSALLRYVVGVLRGEGLRRVWIGASLVNTPSIRGFQSAGFRPAITLAYLRVLRVRHIWLEDDATAPPALAADARRALLGGREVPHSSIAETMSRARAGALLRLRERDAGDS